MNQIVEQFKASARGVNLGGWLGRYRAFALMVARCYAVFPGRSVETNEKFCPNRLLIGRSTAASFCGAAPARKHRRTRAGRGHHPPGLAVVRQILHLPEQRGETIRARKPSPDRLRNSVLLRKS